MKNLNKILMAIMLLFAATAWGQQSDEVTLTVSGDGPTKADATVAALRSAIEQAFGVFVSSDTHILNDELVKDEIATVSSGNIKAYKELAAVTLPNRNQSVTLQATVAVQKLISYAQSHGSSAEFAGQTFAMNMKLRELNKKNEQKILDNLLKQVEVLAPKMFDFEIEVAEPQLSYSIYKVPAKITVKHNQISAQVGHLIVETLSSVSLTEKEIEAYEANDNPYTECVIERNPEAKCVIHVANSNDYDIKKEHALRTTPKGFFYKLAKSLNHLPNFNSTNGLNHARIADPNSNLQANDNPYTKANSNDYDTRKEYALRTTPKDFFNKLAKLLNHALYDIRIVDPNSNLQFELKTYAHADNEEGRFWSEAYAKERLLPIIVNNVNECYCHVQLPVDFSSLFDAPLKPYISKSDEQKIKKGKMSVPEYPYCPIITYDRKIIIPKEDMENVTEFKVIRIQ